MRQGTVTIVGAAALLFGSVVGAQALPMAPDAGASSPVEQVADGCGAGNWRDRRGFCHRGPNSVYGFRPRPVYVAPRVYVRPVYRARPYYYRRW